MSDLWDVPQANKTIDEILQTLYHSYSGADGSKLPVDQATKDIEALITEARIDGCPCYLVEPCTSNCTCANRNMSGGCAMCCKYGSPEQQKASAIKLMGEK